VLIFTFITKAVCAILLFNIPAISYKQDYFSTTDKQYYDNITMLHEVFPPPPPLATGMSQAIVIKFQRSGHSKILVIPATEHKFIDGSDFKLSLSGFCHRVDFWVDNEFSIENVASVFRM